MFGFVLVNHNHDGKGQVKMGTNYYAHTDVCSHCGRGSEEYHIGKSSYGWSFSFQALEDYEAPFSHTIDTYEKWLRALEKCVIRDEYGEEISLEDFKAFVEAKRGGRNHAILHPHESFVDPDGHSFTRCDFS